MGKMAGGCPCELFQHCYVSAAHGLCMHFSYGLPTGEVTGQWAIDSLDFPCCGRSFTGRRWVFKQIPMGKWRNLRPFCVGCRCALNNNFSDLTESGMVDDYLSYRARRVFTCQTLSDVIENVSVEEAVETCGVCLPEVKVQYFLEFPIGSQWAKNYSTLLIVQRTHLGLR